VTNDPTTTPTRNPLGVALDLALLAAGAYAVARSGGRLLKRGAQAGTAAFTLGEVALTVFFLALGVAAVTLAVPALVSNLRRVARDERGRPLSGREGGE
jgi:hypothetical protein